MPKVSINLSLFIQGYFIIYPIIMNPNEMSCSFFFFEFKVYSATCFVGFACFTFCLSGNPIAHFSVHGSSNQVETLFKDAVAIHRRIKQMYEKTHAWVHAPH